MTSPAPDLTVLLPVLNERDNLAALLPRLDSVLRRLGCAVEVLVLDGGSTDGTAEVGRAAGVSVLVHPGAGYGVAIREGLAAARGTYVLTLDADLSHDPDFIARLWRARHRADIVIASRYVTGGAAFVPWWRRTLSRALNATLGFALGLPVADLSSGFRLYRHDVAASIALESCHFEVLEEALVKAYAAGWRVLEVPFTYYPRAFGASGRRLLRVGLDPLAALGRLWALRNSVQSADYDERAFYSRIPLQRYWQRRRHRIITRMARGAGRTLDVGCGSSVIVQSLDAIGLDVQQNKLRYMRKYGLRLLRGSLVALPVRSASLDCVICSQVIEHVPPDPAIMSEFVRVLRPGGLLILGTPDYATIGWRVIEPLYGLAAPGGYKDEHITHYTRASLTALAEEGGLRTVEYAYVARSELIMAFRKPDAQESVAADARRASGRAAAPGTARRQPAE